MIEVTGPDGTVAAFPDGTSPDVIKAAMAKRFGAPKGKTAALKADKATGFLANLNRGLLIGDELAAGIATGVDALTGKVPNGKTLDYVRNLGSAYQRNMANQRGIEDEFSQSNPNSAALARGLGNAATVAVPGAPALQASTRGVNAARGAVAAATLGSGAALADRGSFAERLNQASPATPTGFGNLALNAGLGGLGGALAPALRRAPQRVRPDVATLNRAGVQMTPGQIRGGISQTLEDAATSTPFLGPAIQDARRSGLESFNRSVVNRSLEPIGDALPEGVVGQEAMRYAGDRLGAAYEGLAPARVELDNDFADAVRQSLANANTMTPQGRDTLANILQQRVTSRGEQGALDGDIYRQIQSELGYEIRRFTGSPDPDNRAVAEALTGVRDALEAAAFRQNPDFGQQLGATNRGYAELVRAENAGARGRDGVFTANQYDAAVKAGDPRIRRRGYVRGEALGQDISTAARNVLPSTVPDSGTATRGMAGMVASVPGAVLGTLAGGPVGTLAGIAGTGATLGIASRAYTPRAIQAANEALTRRVGSQEAQAALTELRNLAMQSPANQQLYREVMAKISAGVGVSNATNQAPTSVSGAGIR